MTKRTCGATRAAKNAPTHGMVMPHYSNSHNCSSPHSECTLAGASRLELEQEPLHFSPPWSDPTPSPLNSLQLCTLLHKLHCRSCSSAICLAFNRFPAWLVVDSISGEKFGEQFIFAASCCSGIGNLEDLRMEFQAGAAVRRLPPGQACTYHGR